MKRAIVCVFLALCFVVPGYASAQCPADAECNGALPDPAQIVINDKRNFGLRIGSDEYANQWAYERLDPAFAKRWRKRRVASGAIIATGGLLAYASFQSATLWFVYYALSSFAGDRNDPLIIGWGALSVAGMLGGGGLVYWGATRSKHPYTPDERVGLVDEFNGRR